MKYNLPAPSSLAKAHSDLLKAKIAEEMKRKGPLTFSEFMQRALYEPELGYYSGGARKFGAGGDFVTAPEISPLFSRCVAKQCAQILREIPQSSILEFGAGTGAMAKVILRELKEQNNLPKQYFILEVSPELRDRQQQLLSEFSCVIWLDYLPEKFSGVVLANEVLDAMPVNKFYVDKDIKEFYVNFSRDQFVWHLDKPLNKKMVEKVEKLDLNSNYESEINLFLEPWCRSLSQIMAQGVVLIMDYGFPAREYYHHDRSRGTLMCHYQHRAHEDPLIHVGIQDITAHVDFTALAEAAYDNGFNIDGFVNQAAFLMNCGLLDFFPKEDPVEQYRVSQEIKTLTLPSEMGEIFKVMAFSKNFSQELLGFSSMNRLERL